MNENYRSILINQLLDERFSPLPRPRQLEVWTQAAPGQNEGVAVGVTGYLPNGNVFADELTLNIDKAIYEKSDFISIWGFTEFDSIFISSNNLN